MNLLTETNPETGILEDEKTDEGLASRVLLFNDDWHTFEEVIDQLIKATRCSIKEAQDKTIEVHSKGKAIVFSGQLSSCLKVSGVLEEIALHTQVIT